MLILSKYQMDTSPHITVPLLGTGSTSDLLSEASYSLLTFNEGVVYLFCIDLSDPARHCEG
jgi:hypothetical protein